jgi:hypothetical protein
MIDEVSRYFWNKQPKIFWPESKYADHMYIMYTQYQENKTLFSYHQTLTSANQTYQWTCQRTLTSMIFHLKTTIDFVDLPRLLQSSAELL